MKHSKGTRAAAIAGTLLAAGIVAAGPAGAATSTSAAAPQCSVPARITGAELHANILKAAAADAPGAVLSTRTAGTPAQA